jgi:predicted dehydrogenase
VTGSPPAAGPARAAHPGAAGSGAGLPGAAPAPGSPALPGVAVLGAGAMGRLHARVVATSPRCALRGVVDPSPEAGRRVARRWGVPYARDLADLSDVQAVIVATPSDTHRDTALRLLDAGLPLLVEKPLCPDLDDAAAVVAAAERAGLPLMCGLLERFNPAVRTAMALLGDPVHLTATRHSPYAPRITTGVGWDLLVHDVDLAMQCFGSTPCRVTGERGQVHPKSLAGAEDVAEAVLAFGDGRLAAISASRVGQRKVRSVTIAEVERLLEVDLLRGDVTIHCHVDDDLGADGRGYRQQSVIEIPAPVTSVEPLAAQLDRFLDLLGAGTAGGGEVPDLDAERRSILPPHEVVARVLAGGDSRVAPVRSPESA